MSARKRAHRRIQPYAWLGVGAVTVGMGAALVGGTAVAFADTGADSSTHSSASASAGTSSANAGTSEAASEAASATKVAAKAATKDEAAEPKTRRGPKARAAEATADATDSAPVRRGRSSAPSHSTADLPDLPDAPAADGPAPAAATPVANASKPAAADSAVPSVSDPAPAVDNSPAADDPAPAAVTVPGAAADPAPNMESWLPATPIVPGAHVKLALQQIEQSQALLNQETWGSGNILAGLGSFGPQAALATAQLMLGIWAASIGNAQSFVANTVGNPLLHGIAQANLQNELVYPKLSDASLVTASALITPLGWVGADVAPTKALVAEARENGKVYAKVPVKMVAGTEPVVGVKINGGSKATLLVDTGASGLVTTRDKIGSAQQLGPKIGGGASCFSGGICYHYDTYNTTVDLGDGAVATAPVNIVTDNTEYPDSVKNFKNFFSWGADGILGVGANTAGPGPAPIPTAAMPGELSDGVLIYQNAYPFGLGGYMILGPNLFPTRVSVPGAPDSYVKVSVNGGAKQDAGAIIDSGGVYGTLNRSLYPGAGPFVAAGTKIEVYAPDGATLLYTYTTKDGGTAEVPTGYGTDYIESGLFNTGNAPFEQNPIYLNYGATPYGIGSTDFSIA